MCSDGERKKDRQYAGVNAEGYVGNSVSSDREMKARLKALKHKLVDR